MNLHAKAKRDSIAALFEKKADPADGRRQTVEEFLAAGGKIEKLQPWDTSRPLRFLADRFIDLD